MFLQDFFIEGRHYGQVTREINLRGGAIGKPQSIQLYCGSCGDTFGKFPVVDTNGTPQEWIAYRLCCRKCPPRYKSLVPGSVWMTWEPDFIAALPLSVLKWEFDREIELLDKESKT